MDVIKLITQLSGKQAGGEGEEGGTGALEAVGESAELCRLAQVHRAAEKRVFQLRSGITSLGRGVCSRAREPSNTWLAEVGALRRSRPVP